MHPNVATIINSFRVISCCPILLVAVVGCPVAQNTDAVTAPFTLKPGGAETTRFEGVTASSSQQGLPANLVADSDSATFWVSSGKDPGQGPTRQHPEWLQFNFTALVTAQQLIFSGRPDYGPTDGEVQASDDGKTFRTLKQFKGEKSGEVAVAFDPATAKFFRVAVYGSFDPKFPTSPRNVQIAEARLVGKSDDGKQVSWPANVAEVPASPEWSAPGVIDPAALTINGIYGQIINGQAFQQDALTSFNGWQYLAYYDAARHVCLARRQLPKGQWQIIRLTDYTFKGDDAHNTISLGICPNDGTIHLAFDHHSHPLHYRVSQKNAATQPTKIQWDATLFGSVTSNLEKLTERVTYPMFLRTPKGDLQLFYRYGTSGAGQWWMVDYDAASSSWRRTRQIDSGTGLFKDQFNASKDRNAYPNGFSYGANGRLHYTWTWRENTQGANHDINYAYSDDGGLTWRNNAGTVINPGDGKQVITISSPGIAVVPLDRTRSLMNQQTQAVDSKGRIHVVMWHRQDGKTTTDSGFSPTDSLYYHYWRDDAGKWQKAEIPSEVGTRPHLYFDADDNTYVLYTINRDPKNWSHGIYFTQGQICVAAASSTSRWTQWSIIHREEKGSYLNEMLADGPRFKKERILSILAQHAPRKPGEPTPLRIIDIPLKAPEK